MVLYFSVGLTTGLGPFPSYCIDKGDEWLVFFFFDLNVGCFLWLYDIEMIWFNKFVQITRFVSEYYMGECGIKKGRWILVRWHILDNFM